MLGLPPLDDILADAPQGSRILVNCRPGAEGEALLRQAADHSIATAYLTLVRPPEALRKQLRSKDPLIIDGYSGLIGARDDHALPVFPADEPDALREALAFVREHSPKSGLVVEGLNGLVERRDDVDAAKVVIDEASRFPWSIMHLVDWSNEPMQALIDSCDAVVEVGVVEDRILSNQFIKLERASWTSKTFGPAMLRVSSGRVRLEVPKIIVSGPSDAGKTTFIRAVSSSSAHTEHAGITVSGEHGTVEHEGLRALMWGTPGQARFDALWPTLSKNALAGVLLVPSDRPDDWSEVDRHWKRLRDLGIPLIVIANKQDVAGAMSPDEVRKRLSAPEDVPVLGCNSLDQASATEAMRMLIRNVLNSGSDE